MDYGVRDFVYVITCNGCGEEYIGESGDTLRHRTSLHRNQILMPQYRKLKVSKHIAECAPRPNLSCLQFAPSSNYTIRTNYTEMKKKTI